VLKDLVRVLQQEQYNYRDPITEFLESLYVNFDFEGAQLKLRECETVRISFPFSFEEYLTQIQKKKNLLKKHIHSFFWNGKLNAYSYENICFICF
jgi:hypothetical protein